MPLPDPKTPVPTEGRIPVRVRYCECDPMGVAHHAAYVPWLEMGRTELLRETGITYAHLEQAGVFLVVTSLELKYRRAVFYDDMVEIRTSVRGGSRVKIQHVYEVALLEDGGHGRSAGADAPRAPRLAGEVMAVASSTLACVGHDGRVQPLPAWLVPGSSPA